MAEISSPAGVPEVDAGEVLSDLMAFVAAVDGGKFALARELAARILLIEPENELILKYTEVLRDREDDDEEESESEEDEDEDEDEDEEDDGEGSDGVDGDDSERAGDGAGEGVPGPGDLLPAPSSATGFMRRSIAEAQALDAELNTT
jgi:hypothetical protein